jgi:hypothetical protein
LLHGSEVTFTIGFTHAGPVVYNIKDSTKRAELDRLEANVETVGEDDSF